MEQLPALLPPTLAGRWPDTLAADAGGSLRLFDVIDRADVLGALAPLRQLVQLRLGAAPQIIASQCWVRRAHPMHVWHQDGALHHDFTTRAVLPMLTCWIALVPCGADAPSLEWAVPGPTELLLPAELAEAAVDASHPHRRTALLAAGDALLFDGALLHRTHITPAMTRPRTSIELRFVAAGAPPARLAHETLLPFA